MVQRRTSKFMRSSSRRAASAGAGCSGTSERVALMPRSPAVHCGELSAQHGAASAATSSAARRPLALAATNALHAAPTLCPHGRTIMLVLGVGHDQVNVLGFLHAGPTLHNSDAAWDKGKRALMASNGPAPRWLLSTCCRLRPHGLGLGYILSLFLLPSPSTGRCLMTSLHQAAGGAVGARHPLGLDPMPAYKP